MGRFKEGDKVRIVRREVTAQDMLANTYYEHMAGLVGTIGNVYAKDEYAVQIDLDSLGPVPADVHAEATRRMRAKFADNVGEEQRKLLTKEELNFNTHYVLLVQAADLEKA